MSSVNTLLELLHVAPSADTAVILPEAGIRVTYGSLREQVLAMADALAAAGIEPGHRVAIVLPNGLPAIVAFLAASVAGTAAPLNSGYRQEEFSFYLEDTAAKVLLCPPDGADEARKAAAGKVPVLCSAHGRKRFCAPSRTRPATAAQAPSPQASDIALVLHTSGSTGRPKRVPIRHGNLAASASNIVKTYALSAGRCFSLRDAALPCARLGGVHAVDVPLRRRRGGSGKDSVRSRFGGWCATTASLGTPPCQPFISFCSLERAANGRPASKD